MENTVGIIILAAGKGTRMQSDKAKVLHDINGTPMIHYVMAAAQKTAGDNIYVVVGHQAETVKNCVAEKFIAKYPIQEKQLGTGHAVMCALPEISEKTDRIVILCGDVPLIKADTINSLIQTHDAAGAAVTVLAVQVDNPFGYGRIVTDDAGAFCCIVEQCDANVAEQKINLINSGIYCVDRHFLDAALKKIGNDNTQAEYYLTDIIEIAYNQSSPVALYTGSDATEVMGINTIDQLNEARSIVTRT